MPNKDTLKERVEDDFIEFWDTHADKLGLGKYSSEITRFWLDKIEQTIKEERDRILEMIEKEYPSNTGLTAFIHKDNIISIINNIKNNG